MQQDNIEYQRQKDAVERDLSMLQYYTNIDQANAKEARGYDFQTQQDLRNFDQQKELAKMGYNNQFNLANLNFRNDMTQLAAQQGFQATQNAIKSFTDTGVPYEEAKARVMGASGTIVDRSQAVSQYGSTPAVRNFNPGNITDT